MKWQTGKQGASWKATMLLSAIIGVSHISCAPGNSAGRQATNTSGVENQLGLPNNKGPVATLSTNSPNLTVTSPGNSTAVPGNSATSQMGGVSDGGGNAVGSVLFDFYENQDSVQISVEELVTLDPRAKQMIQKLDQQLPAIGDMTSPGLGTLLIEHISPKNIFLESKPITSQGCLNQSMVGSKDQAVVACQSDTELRLNRQWLKSTDSKNRAGLILHEMVLAWAREVLKGKFDKNAIEQKVRMLNRAIFDSQTNEELANAVSSIIGVKAFSAKNFALMRTLPSKLTKASEVFCKNPKQSPRAALKEYFDDPVLHAELPWDIILMEQAANKINGYQTSPESQKTDVRVKRLCASYLFDQLPVEKPEVIPGGLSCSEFEADTATQTDLIASYTKGRRDDDENYRKHVVSAAIEKIIINAHACYLKNGKADEALYLLPRAAKWELKTKAGLEISFVKRTAQ